MADGLLGQLPLEMQPELQGINRQQQMAQMLMQQAFQQPQGQMVSGRYVAPGLLQQLQPLAAAYVGSKGLEAAEKQQQDLARQLREGKSQALGTFQELISKPETRGQAMQYASKNPYLQGMVQELMKPQKLGEGENIVMPSIGGGEPITLAGGGVKIAPEIKQSMQMLGINKPLDQLTSQELQAINSNIYSLKNAGAGKNITYVGNKSIAEQVGPIMAKEQEKTIAANKIFDAANNLTTALDTNKIYTGTGANVRLGLAQLANTAGFGGNTLEEKIANTRTGIQSLAQLTLQGRKEMKGEGAIQVQEGQLAERAISGDINFTPTELKILANAAKRSAEYTQNQYERKLQHMAADKETAALVPYFAVPPITPAGGSGWRIK